MAKKRVFNVSKITGVSKAASKSSNIASPSKKDKHQDQLDGARFRWLNESLYTESSSKSFEQFQKDPKLFSTYHSGFRSQTKAWPVNPVDECLAFATAKLAPGSVIGDFGCGDAKLAESLEDMAVFSLSLMGTDWPKFVAEALRCLKVGGFLYVAEVQSRVTDFDKFKSGLQQAGDLLQAENLKERYFVKVVVRKMTNKPVQIDSALLKACLYKKR